MNKFRKNLKALSVVLIAGLALAPLQTQASPVFDGYFQVEQKKNANVWAEEDKKIDEKLANLEKRFGKKPN